MVAYVHDVFGFFALNSLFIAAVEDLFTVPLTAQGNAELYIKPYQFTVLCCRATICSLALLISNGTVVLWGVLQSPGVETMVQDSPVVFLSFIDCDTLSRQ